MGASEAYQDRGDQMPAAHPNEFDRKRIERALSQRRRYRYVAAKVHVVTRGYRIESPCCSRNVDSAGGPIDIALLEYVPGRRMWQLYFRNHGIQEWALYEEFPFLNPLIQHLNDDPERIFWP